MPVYIDKAATDASYERLTRTLFDACDVVHPAIAGHNLRSLAHAVAAARERSMAPDAWEVQMLYGMAEPLQRAVVEHGARLRVYVPTGELVTGIAYLIRRLLENTAGTSILRQTYAEGHDLEALISSPEPAAAAPRDEPHAADFANTPLIDFSKRRQRKASLRRSRACDSSSAETTCCVSPACATSRKNTNR